MVGIYQKTDFGFAFKGLVFYRFFHYRKRFELRFSKLFLQSLLNLLATDFIQRQPVLFGHDKAIKNEIILTGNNLSIVNADFFLTQGIRNAGKKVVSDLRNGAICIMEL